jgi:hypothetical protein
LTTLTASECSANCRALATQQRRISDLSRSCGLEPSSRFEQPVLCHYEPFCFDRQRMLCKLQSTGNPTAPHERFEQIMRLGTFKPL